MGTRLICVALYLARLGDGDARKVFFFFFFGKNGFAELPAIFNRYLTSFTARGGKRTRRICRYLGNQIAVRAARRNPRLVSFGDLIIDFAEQFYNPLNLIKGE